MNDKYFYREDLKDLTVETHPESGAKALTKHSFQDQIPLHPLDEAHVEIFRKDSSYLGKEDLHKISIHLYKQGLFLRDVYYRQKYLQKQLEASRFNWKSAAFFTNLFLLIALFAVVFR